MKMLKMFITLLHRKRQTVMGISITFIKTTNTTSSHYVNYHTMVHEGKIIISGFVMTSEGLKLHYEVKS